MIISVIKKKVETYKDLLRKCTVFQFR